MKESNISNKEMEEKQVSFFFFIIDEQELP